MDCGWDFVGFEVLEAERRAVWGGTAAKAYGLTLT